MLHVLLSPERVVFEAYEPASRNTRNDVGSEVEQTPVEQTGCNRERQRRHSSLDVYHTRYG